MAVQLLDVQTLVGPPRLKQDLVIRRQHTAQGPVLVLKDPVHERFFRFREMEAFILEQLDGRTSPDHIRGAILDKFGSALSAESLDQFLSKLNRLGLLERATPGAPAHSAQSN